MTTMADELSLLLWEFIVLISTVLIVYILFQLFDIARRTNTKAKIHLKNTLLFLTLFILFLVLVSFVEQVVFQRTVCFGVSCKLSIPRFV
jgi:hypothetical protein